MCAYYLSVLVMMLVMIWQAKDCVVDEEYTLKGLLLSIGVTTLEVHAFIYTAEVAFRLPYTLVIYLSMAWVNIWLIWCFLGALSRELTIPYGSFMLDFASCILGVEFVKSDYVEPKVLFLGLLSFIGFGYFWLVIVWNLAVMGELRFPPPLNDHRQREDDVCGLRIGSLRISPILVYLIYHWVRIAFARYAGG